MRFSIIAIIAFTCFVSSKAFAQTTTIKKGKYTLTFINQDPKFDPAIQDKLVNTFFKVYPKEAKRFNKNTVKQVTLTIDTAYTGVAYAHDGKITIASKWLQKRPGDIDVITHEAMHLVQAYPPNSGPGWLTEGIADYVRHVYGVDNAGANWSLPDLTDKHHYTNSYRITARFLLWAEKTTNKKLVNQLDAHMRNATYTPDLWKALTGKTVDELWDMYKANPAL
jgi:hypothetical protein